MPGPTELAGVPRRGSVHDQSLSVGVGVIGRQSRLPGALKRGLGRGAQPRRDTSSKTIFLNSVLNAEPNERGGIGTADPERDKGGRALAHPLPTVAETDVALARLSRRVAARQGRGRARASAHRATRGAHERTAPAPYMHCRPSIDGVEAADDAKALDIADPPLPSSLLPPPWGGARGQARMKKGGPRRNHPFLH